MSKLADFYKKAESDDALKEALKKANIKAKEENITALIKVAGEFGISLDRNDFGDLDEDDLKAVAGGWYGEPRCSGTCKEAGQQYYR
ncbi:MAG: hypothetical protein LBQ58_04225 [Synergistaceae bacterium]|jgi:hypothetical protein|nr:hypothetical protein [Synergistaceae bacterium]